MARTKRTKLDDATRLLQNAKRDLIRARRALARESKPGDAAIEVAPSWKWAARLLEKRRPQLMKIPGVVGCGLGFRYKDDEETGEPCITVFVRRKWSRKTIEKRKLKRIPHYFREGKRRIDVDVVAAGRLKRQLDVGRSLGPVNLHQRGTLGAYAEELASSAALALTAMHVSGIPEFPAPGAPPVTFRHPSVLDPGAGAQLGQMTEGTMQGVDACKIALDDPSIVRPVIPGIGKIMGWRPVTYPGDRGTPVRLHGAVSGFRMGTIINPFVPLPDEDLDAAIVVGIDTQWGDSGCALVDPANLILGFLVGEMAGGLRVFTPASLVLGRLTCDITVF
ncbi:MAG: hypothetical protein GY716_25630 [bacterium]|nr:hypothetical protein [bacterium]